MGQSVSVGGQTYRRTGYRDILFARSARLYRIPTMVQPSNIITVIPYYQYLTTQAIIYTYTAFILTYTAITMEPEQNPKHWWGRPVAVK